MMRIVMEAMIVCGILLMVTNIYRYVKFLKKSKDVISGGKGGEDFWKMIALVLLSFFLVGYIGILVLTTPDMLMACILLGGSIFVAIVLTLMFRLVNTVKERSMELSEVLIGVIEARDPNLNGHSLCVRDLTMLFWEYLPGSMKNGISPVSLEYAALLHDVGKLGIPESILNKPGMLSEEEWYIMQRHPKIGVEILKPITSFAYINDWILFHHERVDGNGYYKVVGDKVPLPAKMIAITDTYSAIRMKRSYKEPKTHEEAIRIIKEAAGKQFDAELTEIFCGIPYEKIQECINKNVDTI